MKDQRRIAENQQEKNCVAAVNSTCISFLSISWIVSIPLKRSFATKYAEPFVSPKICNKRLHYLYVCAVCALVCFCVCVCLTLVSLGFSLCIFLCSFGWFVDVQFDTKVKRKETESKGNILSRQVLKFDKIRDKPKRGTIAVFELLSHQHITAHFGARL